MQKNEIPIIIDFIFNESESLVIAATSNKKLIFWSLHTPNKGSGRKPREDDIGPVDITNRFYSKILFIYSSTFPISSLFYLKQYKILVLNCREKFLSFHKFKRKVDEFELNKIGFLEEKDKDDPNEGTHSDVIRCVEEIWKSGFIVTGGLDGRIKAWDARNYCSFVNKKKSFKKVDFDYICDLAETDYQDHKFTKKAKKSSDAKNMNPQVNMVMSAAIGEGKKGVKMFCYSHVLGGVLLSLGFERHITVWSPDTSLSKAYIGKLQGHNSIVQDMKFIPGTLICISVDQKFSFRIWDVRKLEVIQSIKEAS